MKRTLLSALVLSVAATACSYEAEAPQPKETTERSASALSLSTSYYWWSYAYGFDLSYMLNGRDLNGRSLNGQDLSGHAVIGASLTNVRLDGELLENVQLDETNFSAKKTKAKKFVGATFDGVIEDGSVLPLRIDAIHPPDKRGVNVTRYSVSYQTQEGWKPFCGRDADGNAVKAIPLAGRWDYRQGVAGGGSRIDDPEAVTFACDGFALAKCVDLGYQPWLNVRECRPKKCDAIPMRDLHQACTRAIRADYCGDGTSYTDDGKLIDVADAYGIRSLSDGWPMEAEWDASGARCAVRQRVPARGTPTCWNQIFSSSCGVPPDFSDGTLVITQDSP